MSTRLQDHRLMRTCVAIIALCHLTFACRQHDARQQVELRTPTSPPRPVAITAAPDVPPATPRCTANTDCRLDDGADCRTCNAALRRDAQAPPATCARRPCEDRFAWCDTRSGRCESLSADPNPANPPVYTPCTRDDDCSTTYSCDCRRCGAFPRDLCVQPCPQPCERNACASVEARCDVATHRCVAVNTRRPADTCDGPCFDDRACVVATPPDCGVCVAVTRDQRSEGSCVARGCRANACDERRYGARCDRETHRCVLFEAP
jgi:hypothetical protein